jgi:hypothetical protein
MRLPWLGTEQLQGARNRLAELLVIEADALPRLLDKVTKRIVLASEVVLTLAV